MKSFFHDRQRRLPSFLLLLAVCLACGCTRAVVRSESLPPVLAQCELMRPYDKVADLVVRRERYGAPQDVSPADYSWAYQALREEAARIGADAVIFPEVSVEVQTYMFFPSSEMKAKGVAVRFH